MPIRVLIVDDVPDLRAMFTMVLSRDGRFEIVGEAEDGLEAIERARELQPDIVLLDIAMPRLDGLQAIPRIHAAAPGVRILVVSGFGTKELAERAIAACATAFLEKGVHPDELTLAAVRVHDSPPKKVCVA